MDSTRTMACIRPCRTRYQDSSHSASSVAQGCSGDSTAQHHKPSQSPMSGWINAPPGSYAKVMSATPSLFEFFRKKTPVDGSYKPTVSMPSHPNLLPWAQDPLRPDHKR